MDTCSLLDILHVKERERVSKVSESDAQDIRTAINKGMVMIVLGGTNITELLAGIQRDGISVVEELEELKSLSDARRFIGDPSEMIRSALSAYEPGSVARPVFYAGTPLWEWIREIAAQAPANDSMALRIVEDARKQGEKWIGGMRELYSDIVSQWQKTYCCDPWSKPSGFNDEWPSLSRTVARAVAMAGGVDLRERQIDRVLDQKAMRMLVGYLASRIYDAVRYGRTKQDGDWGDMLHAVSGSVCDLLVTRDGPLTARLAFVPQLGTTVTDMSGLLSQLKHG